MSVQRVSNKQTLIKLIVPLIGIIVGLASNILSRYGQNPDYDYAFFFTTIRDAIIVVIDVPVVLYPLFTHYPTKLSRKRAYTLLIPLFLVVIAMTSLRAIWAPQGNINPNLLAHKIIYVMSTVIWWLNIAILPTFLFWRYSDEAKREVPNQNQYAVAPDTEDGKREELNQHAVAPDTEDGKREELNQHAVAPDTDEAKREVPNQYAISTDGTVTSNQASNRPFSLAGYIAICNIFAGITAITVDLFLDTNLMSYTTALLIPWAAVVLYEKRTMLRADIGYMLIAIFFLGGVPLGAGSFFLGAVQSVNTLEGGLLRFLGQLGIISAWAIITYILRTLFRKTMNYATDPCHSLVLILPMTVIEHMFNRLVFLSEIQVDVVATVISFAVFRAMIRDSGMYQPIVHRLWRRAEETRSERWARLKDNQVWLELSSWHNFSTAVIVFAMILLDRYFCAPLNLGSIHGLTFGISDSYMLQILWIYPTMIVVSLFSYTFSSFYIRRQLSNLRGEIIGNEEKVPRNQQSLARYWDKYWAYQMMVTVWAVAEAAWLSDRLRHPGAARF